MVRGGGGCTCREEQKGMRGCMGKLQDVVFAVIVNVGKQW